MGRSVERPLVSLYLIQGLSGQPQQLDVGCGILARWKKICLDIPAGECEEYGEYGIGLDQRIFFMEMKKYKEMIA